MADVPDVCNTPPIPTPVPYPNVAFSRDLANGTTTVVADGGNMCANYGSEFSKSTGDEAGSAGGVKSGTFLKEATWMTYSFDVKLEGKGACRLSDKMFHNHGNIVNTPGESQKSLTPAKPCTIDQAKANIEQCPFAKEIRRKATLALGREPKVNFGDLPGDTLGSTNSSGDITLRGGRDCCGLTATLLHEYTHSASHQQLDELRRWARQGAITREKFLKLVFMNEVEARNNSLIAFYKCGKAWGCAPEPVPDFGLTDDGGLVESLAESYGEKFMKEWDELQKLRKLEEDFLKQNPGSVPF